MQVQPLHPAELGLPCAGAIHLAAIGIIQPAAPTSRAYPAPAATFHARDVLCFKAVPHLYKQC